MDREVVLRVTIRYSERTTVERICSDLKEAADDILLPGLGHGVIEVGDFEPATLYMRE